MTDRHRRQDEDMDQRDEHRRQKTEAVYTQARSHGSLEGERAAQQSLDMQTVRNQIDRLERRMAALEDEITALKGQR